MNANLFFFFCKSFFYSQSVDHFQWQQFFSLLLLSSFSLFDCISFFFSENKSQFINLPVNVTSGESIYNATRKEQLATIFGTRKYCHSFQMDMEKSVIFAILYISNRENFTFNSDIKDLNYNFDCAKKNTFLVLNKLAQILSVEWFCVCDNFWMICF